MRILDISKAFRPKTSHVYPPFKKGRYLEEYMYEYLLTHDIQTDRVYIPVFWTNMQNHPGFNKEKYNLLLQFAIQKLPSTTNYFTIVQHDDGPQLTLPRNTLVFGACSGTVPLPLLYEDTDGTLLNTPRTEKTILASFVGQLTHPIRRALFHAIKDEPNIVCHAKEGWTVNVSDDAAALFVRETLAAKFCLAPRGYGRSSFRFFEAMQLGTVPVYVWDDKEWLPYQDELDYSQFSVSIHQGDIQNLARRLRSIRKEEYEKMQENLTKVQHWFTLEGMASYIARYLQRNATLAPILEDASE